MEKLAKIILRCDASNEIGFGHLRRCLNLAQWLRGKFEVAFCIKKTKEVQDILKDSGYEVCYLKKELTSDEEQTAVKKFINEWQPRVVINDIRNTTAEYMRSLSLSKIKIINFDDRGTGAEEADVLIDANRRENKKKFFGPKYVVLHSNYPRENKKERKLNKNVKNMVISIGGGDPHGYTDRLLECLEEIETKFYCAVLLGPTFNGAKQIKKKWDNHEYIHFIDDLDLLVKPFLWADCAIVNGGVTMFEALCVGVPTLIISQNEEEVKNVKRLERKDALLDIGLGEKLSVNKLNKRLQRMCDSLEYREKMSKNGKEIVDGQGIFRVLGLIEKYARKA